MQCARCKCTDENPCEGGCYWIEPDLCSGCVPSIRQLLMSADAELEVAARFREGGDSASADRHLIAWAVFRAGAAIAARTGPSAVFLDSADLGIDLGPSGLVVPR